jgi:hypothetical protein
MPLERKSVLRRSRHTRSRASRNDLYKKTCTRDEVSGGGTSPFVLDQCECAPELAAAAL